MNYYVDSILGNDDNCGTNPEQAWATLDRVNGTVFAPGDQICFRAGGTWKGQLHPQGSGTAEAPIRIGRYGEGEKPTIDGDGRFSPLVQAETEAMELQQGAVVVLFNQDYWEISDLHVVNQADDKESRFGILLRWHNYGTGRHVYVKNCVVENISGRYVEVRGRDDMNARFQGDGIMAISTGTVGGVPTNFDDVVIEGNVLKEIYRTAITIWSQWTAREGSAQYWQNEGGNYTFHTTVGEYKASTNVIVRHNEIRDIAGDGILINTCDGCLVEYNNVYGCNKYSAEWNAGVWPHNSDNTIMQYNSIFDTYHTMDGQALDIDLDCHGTIVQNNYTYNNEGGFLLIMFSTSGNIVRNNISIADRCAIFDMNSDEDVLVENNIFYVTAPLQRGNNMDLKPSWTFTKNVFYGAEEGTEVEAKTAIFTGNSYKNIANTAYDATAGCAEDKTEALQRLLADPYAVDYNNKSLEENAALLRGLF